MQGARHDPITQNPSHYNRRPCCGGRRDAGIGGRWSQGHSAGRRSRAAAPNFVGITRWFNSAPLSIGELRGRVVLVDFWTYGCYNCVNTLPYVSKALRPIQGQGLPRGRRLHTPEFPFERSKPATYRLHQKRHESPILWHRTMTSGNLECLGTINTGRPNTSSTSAATSSSVMPVRANMMKSSAPFDVS